MCAEVAQVCVDGSGQVPDVCLVEVGGTVGDIESLVFLEALRQMQARLPRDSMAFLHLSSPRLASTTRGSNTGRHISVW